VKVDSSTNPNLPPLNGGVQRSQQGDTAAAGTSGARTPAPATSGGTDADVNLSALTGQLRSLAASGSADIDTAHVESIKQAIRDGSLQIDASKIADGVLETARGLLQGAPQSGN
jgi:negative regulator of flagellin synthesis FlgM